MVLRQQAYHKQTFRQISDRRMYIRYTYYITLEERDRIFNADLSATPQLAIQRDIFIFQTLIGCRVSDLYRMTKLNVVNEAIEYIPKKTKEGNPVTVRVPLNDKAKEILERHKEYKGKLLPFISEQKYNVP